MIIYDFGCTGGHVFEAAVAGMTAADPSCPTCGATTRRRPSRVNVTGASTGPSRDQMPRSWRAVGNGDPQTIRHWHTLAARREKLEDRHPELAGDRRPVLAHEGIFARRPLRAGEDIPTAMVEAATAHQAAGTTSASPAGGSR